MVKRLEAPITTFGSVGLVVMAFVALGMHDGVGPEDGEAFEAAWVAWRACGALAIAVFLTMFIVAVKVLRRPAGWGLESVAKERTLYLTIASVTTIALMAAKALGYTFSPESPVTAIGARTNVILFSGLAASAPWLAIVWLGTEASRRHDAHGLEGRRREGLEQLLKLWRLLVLCAGAFSVGVVAALLTSGALRNAMLAYAPDRSDFPAISVLLYGAVFAVALTVLTLPFAIVWRARAKAFGRVVLPPPRRRPRDGFVGG